MRVGFGGKLNIDNLGCRMDIASDLNFIDQPTKFELVVINLRRKDKTIGITNRTISAPGSGY
jgi:hypothetical protein